MINWKQWFFGITGKDIYEVILSTSSSKCQKSDTGVSSSGTTPATAVLIHEHGDIILEKDTGILQLNVENESECLPSSTRALHNIEICRVLEIKGDDVPVKTSFTKNDKVDEKKTTKRRRVILVINS